MRLLKPIFILLFQFTYNWTNSHQNIWKKGASTESTVFRFLYLDHTYRLWCTVTFLNEIVHKYYISTYVHSYPIIYKKAPGSSFPSNAACNYYISISASFWQQYVVSQGTDWIESSFGLIKGITFLLYREEKAFFFPLLCLLSEKKKSSFLAWSINVTYKLGFQSLCSLIQH